jgi:hypothetical protein
VGTFLSAASSSSKRDGSRRCDPLGELLPSVAPHVFLDVLRSRLRLFDITKLIEKRN